MVVGILRVAAYSAAVSQPLHVPPDSPEFSGTAIQHFHDKLLHIKDRLKTHQGRKLGAQRHQLASRAGYTRANNSDEEIDAAFLGCGE